MIFVVRRWILGFVVGVITASAVWHVGYRYGKNEVLASQSRMIAEMQVREDQLIKRLEEETKKRKVVYVEKVKEVKGAPDPNGCADVAMPERICRELRSSSPDVVCGARLGITPGL